MEDKSSSSQLRAMFETTQGKTISMAGLTVITVVLLIFFAIRPAYVSITSKISENERKREYLANAESKINTLVSLNTVYQQNVAGIERLRNDLLPDSTNEAFMTRNIVELVDSRDLSLISFRIERKAEILDPDFIEDTSNVLESPFNISVSGELEDVESFLTTLERYPRIINIESVNYSRSEEDVENNVWILAVKGFFYTWRDV